MPDDKQQQPTETKAPTTQAPSEMENLKAQLAKATQELEGYRKKDTPTDDKREQSLNDKARHARDESAQKHAESKALENALSFHLSSSEFLKQNESVLPKGIGDIFKVADKETYDSAIHKANAIKDGVVQVFFGEQANVDLLTPSQKSDLAEFQKLTKSGREAKASDVYRNLFEPTLEAMKRIKKAEELNRTRQPYQGSSGDKEYKEKLMALSRKHYLGESSDVKSVR